LAKYANIERFGRAQVSIFTPLAVESVIKSLSKKVMLFHIP